ncbi:MAG: hypothetical protein AB1Z98_16295 [Nannocystaceae bacterium]
MRDEPAANCVVTTRNADRWLPRALASLAVVGLAFGGGCTRLAEGHCANGSGDQQCREREQGMFCSQCTLDNDGCVELLPVDAMCRVVDSSAATAGTASGSSGSGSGETDTHDDAAPTETGQGSSGGIPSCTELGNTCLPAAPADFDGPVVVLTGLADGPPASCAEPFGRQSTEAFSGLDAPDAECPCDCGLLVGVECGGAQVRRHGVSGCLGAPTNTANLIPGCNDFPGTWSVASGSFFYQAPTVIAGSCTPQSTVDVQPATYLDRHLVCGGTFEQGACAGGELCVPPPGGELAPQWCVWQDGEHECPADSVYVEQTVLYRGVTDGRGCEACTCELPQGACTGAVATLAVAGDCMGAAAGTLSPDACVNAIGAGPAADAVSMSAGSPPSSECTPSAPEPTGTATPAEPVTLCCTR